MMWAVSAALALAVLVPSTKSVGCPVSGSGAGCAAGLAAEPQLALEAAPGEPAGAAVLPDVVRPRGGHHRHRICRAGDDLHRADLRDDLGLDEPAVVGRLDPHVGRVGLEIA